jgi:hypothetical protein
LPEIHAQRNPKPATTNQRTQEKHAWVPSHPTPGFDRGKYRYRNHLPNGEGLLMRRGIVGPFETWKQGIPHPCLRGDIEKVAGLTVNEPDDGVVHFARWRPLDHNAVSRSAVLAPAREEDGSGREVAADAIARLCGR